MGHLAYLFAAFAVLWLGLFVYVWMLRRDAQRLSSDVAALTEQDR